jgi:hypothetical protein
MNRPQFHYTNVRKTLHSLPAEMDDLIEVVGDPDNGCYEWIIRTPAGIERHSDEGYGIPLVALRDALIAYYGLPDEGVAA